APRQAQPAPPPPPAVAMPSVVTAPHPPAKVPSLLTMSIPPPVQYAATPSYGAAVLPSFRLVVDPLTGQCTFQPDVSAPVAYQPSYPAPTGLVYPPRRIKTAARPKQPATPKAAPAPPTPCADQPKRITVVDVITKEYAAEGNYSNYFPLPPALPLSSNDDMASIKTIEEYLKQCKRNLRVSIEATKAPAFDLDQFRTLTEPIKHYTCAF